MIVGLSQPGTPQKYHRMSESESVAQAKDAVDPTTTLASDEFVVIRLPQNAHAQHDMIRYEVLF